jgi:hypothetical protein
MESGGGPSRLRLSDGVPFGRAQEKQASSDIAERMAKIVINANPQQGGKP